MAAIERVGDGGEVMGSVLAQVGALREVLAQQPVGILVRASLPGALGVAEIHLEAGVDPKLIVLGHLGTLIPCEGATQVLRQFTDRCRDRIANSLSAMPSQRGTVLGSRPATVALHGRQVQTDDQLAAEERIVWEQDPALHPYVRQTLVVTTNRRRPIRAPRYAVATGVLVATRVGYSVLWPDAPHDARSGPRCFLRRVFWLKHYDRSLDPNGEHYRDDCPAEAVEEELEERPER